MNSVTPFNNPANIADYAETTPQRVPGYSDLHRMSAQLISEKAGSKAEILVLGAGGGLELKAFTQLQPGWKFIGIDPSLPMLELARNVLGNSINSSRLIHGYIEDAPAGPFDGATCFLTLHFLDAAERLRVLKEIRQRLKPGAPLIIAHHTCPVAGEERIWLARSIKFAAKDTMDPQTAEKSAIEMAKKLPLLTPEKEEEMLLESGFSHVSLFYAALSFRGWVAMA